MKMQDLKSYGFSNNLIEIWEKEEGPDLLPVQVKAVREFDILDPSSKNLLVIAPTSSGKTFVGELAAVKEALEMRRVIFLVPFRAIAEELFTGFATKYIDYGIDIVISDRDHREFDEDITAFWESLKHFFTGASFLKHKLYFEDQIDHYQKMIEEENRRNFLDDW